MQPNNTDKILSNIDNPAALEQLYQSDKTGFRRAFELVYPANKDHMAFRFWQERLQFGKQEPAGNGGIEWRWVILASLIAAFLVKIPLLFSIDEEYFFSRNIGFIVFPLLAVYFCWKNRLSVTKTGIIGGAMVASLLYINLLPNDKESDTLVLACMHLILFLWYLLGMAFIGDEIQSTEKRLGYFRYNGDLVVMTTLILLAGGILSAVTIGLFELIGLRIGDFYFNYVAVSGLAAAPIVATYLTQRNPQLVGKVSPIIARLFSPLVLVMLVIYLIAIFYSGKDPYNDREFLILFNALLAGVLAIVFFSIAETSKSTTYKTESWILLLLCAVTIVINGIALSAILFRISSWGITPNRMAVLGGNILFLIHLFLVTVQLVKVVSKGADMDPVGRAISGYLPVYATWTVIVTFIFPMLFGFK